MLVVADTWDFVFCSIRPLLVNLHQKHVVFVVMRLDIRKMEKCLWLVMCVDFLCVDHVMSMRGVKGTRAVLNATLAISATKVSFVRCFCMYYCNGRL